MRTNKSLVYGMLGIIIGLCIENTVIPYAIFNRSSDPNDESGISILTFKNEKSAQEFFEQLGWNQRVEDVSDKSAAVSLYFTAICPFCLTVGALTMAATKIAEKAILDKYIWNVSDLLITPSAKTAILKDLGLSSDTLTDTMAQQVASGRDDVLIYKTGTAWLWKAIADRHGTNGNNPFIIVCRPPNQQSGLPTATEIFQKLQQGINYMKMEITGATYINRAAIAIYKGKNKFDMYLPFVPTKYATKIHFGGIPEKDIQWLTLDEAKKKNTAMGGGNIGNFLTLYDYMTGSQLQEIEDLAFMNEIKDGKKFDKGTAFLFKNNSDHPVHAFLIRQADLAQILKAGGWTQKSINKFLDISQTVGGLAVDAATGLPISLVTNLGFKISKGILGDFFEHAAQGIAIDAIHPKDYFADIFPGFLRYSYFANIKPGVSRPPTAKQTEFPKGARVADDMVIAIFPSDEKKAPDLSKPEYVGDFDPKMYNGVIFWPKPGEIDFIKYDVSGTTAKITQKDIAIDVPVELSDNDEVTVPEEGQNVIKQESKAAEKVLKSTQDPEKKKSIKKHIDDANEYVTIK